MPKINKSYVYLIQDTDKENTYKIGVTKNIVKYRKDELQTGNSSELSIVNTFQTEHPYKIEAFLHRKHKEKRIMNEWFLLEDEDVNSFIKDCEMYEGIIRSLENNPYFSPVE